MVVYNKLVRDKIPEIIEESGRKAKIRYLDNEEFYEALKVKLLEEMTEFLESDRREEIADVLEVLDAILKAKGIGWDEIRQLQDEKRYARGGFEEKVFLVEAE